MQNSARLSNTSLLLNITTGLLVAVLFFFNEGFSQSTGLVTIPGTKCQIIPPAGFTAATGFSGFQNGPALSSIMFTEMPVGQTTILKGFDEAALKSQGMEMIGIRVVIVNGSKANILKLRQKANGVSFLKELLLFGDEKHTVMVNGIYPEDDKEMAAEIHKALLTTKYDANLKEDPLDAVNFSVDVSGTDFKFAKFISGNLLYSVDGKVPSETPALIVGRSIGGVAPERQEAFAKERIKKYPRGEQSVIRDVKPITIDNMVGYEIVADGKSKSGGDALVYQVMLFAENGEYYLLLGQTNEVKPEYLGNYRKVAKTFKRK